MLNKLDELISFTDKYCTSYLNHNHIMGLLGYNGNYLFPVNWVENIDEIDDSHLVDEEEIISFLLTLGFKKEKQLGTDYITILFSCNIETLLIKVTYYFNEDLDTYTYKSIAVFYKQIRIMFDTLYNGFFKNSPNHNWYVTSSENLFNYLLKL